MTLQRYEIYRRYARLLQNYLDHQVNTILFDFTAALVLGNVMLKVL